MSNWRNLLIALLAAVLLAGCATVPISGPVVQELPQVPGVDTEVRVEPLPPAPDASELLVVEGFLHAMSIYQEDYRVARQYLTEDANHSWHPESGVEIYADGYPPAEYGQNIMLVAPRVGSLDAQGSFEADTAGSTEQVRHDFGIVKTSDGQWRISNPPTGLLVSRYSFITSFTKTTLHYLDRTEEVLVPELRYFAAGPQALTAAVTAQLGGPSSQIRDAVRTPAFPFAKVDQVLVTPDGVAQVALSGRIPDSASIARDELLAEITYTLTGFDQVDSVEVTVGDRPAATRSGDLQLRRRTFAELSPDNLTTPISLVVLRDDSIVKLREPDWQPSAQIPRPAVDSALIAMHGEQLATVNTEHTQLLLTDLNTSVSETLRFGTGLLRPQFARNFELWSVEGTGLSTLQVWADGSLRQVEATGLPDSPLAAFAVSADGARVALVFRDAERTQVGVAVIVRDGDSIRLTAWRSLPSITNPAGASQTIDVGWSSATDLLVLQRSPTGETSVFRVSQDGSLVTDVGPINAVDLIRLAVVPGRDAVLISSAGSGYRFEGDFDWRLALSQTVDAGYSN